MTADQATKLRMCLRAGQVSLDSIQAAAALGDFAAREALGADRLEDASTGWEKGVSCLNEVAARCLASDLAARVWDNMGLEGGHPHRRFVNAFRAAVESSNAALQAELARGAVGEVLSALVEEDPRSSVRTLASEAVAAAKLRFNELGNRKAQKRRGEGELEWQRRRLVAYLLTENGRVPPFDILASEVEKAGVVTEDGKGDPLGEREAKGKPRNRRQRREPAPVMKKKEAAPKSTPRGQRRSKGNR